MPPVERRQVAPPSVSARMGHQLNELPWVLYLIRAFSIRVEHPRFPGDDERYSYDMVEYGPFPPSEVEDALAQIREDYAGAAAVEYRVVNVLDEGERPVEPGEQPDAPESEDGLLALLRSVYGDDNVVEIA